MNPDQIGDACAGLTGSQRATLAVRLYARIAMQSIDVLVLDEVITASDDGITVNQLADRLQLEQLTVATAVDALRSNFLCFDDQADDETTSNMQAEAEGGARKSLRLNYRTALPFVAASVAKCFGVLTSTALGDVPPRLQRLLENSRGKRGFEDHVRCNCCPGCAMAQRSHDLKPVYRCPLCSRDVAMSAAAAAAKWVLGAPPADRPDRASLPFVVPVTFERDERLCVLALMFEGLLFREPLAVLTSDAVVPSPELLLSQRQMAIMSSQAAGSHSLRYVQPKQLKVVVATRHALRVEKARHQHHLHSQRGGRGTSRRRALPPWLAVGDEEPDDAQLGAESEVMAVAQPLPAALDLSRKRHRREDPMLLPGLVCAAQLPPSIHTAALDDDDSDFEIIPEPVR